MNPTLTALALACAPVVASAQDFYDIDTLRTVDLVFHDANWWTLLQQNYNTGNNILADMTVEGVTYPSVGVAIRGNTSYTSLPSGSQKVSLGIEVDQVNDQEVMGYKNLNFNNAHRDPTFCREVVYHNILAEWMPSGRANHIVVRINGENWGVYANVQQFDKTMLEQFFADEDGMRVKCANNPNGPGLQYAGTNPSSYSGYELKEDGGLADPIGELIALCNAVDNVSGANWPLIDQSLAIDPSIWTVALENLYSDDDSYVNKGADFVLYRNPDDGRSHILQTDGNETWTDAGWAADYKFNQSNKPVLNNVLSSAEMRGRYMAHLRAALEDLDWAVIGQEFEARKALIDAAVQADTKKLYSYSAFLNNFNTTVNLGGGGPFGGNVIGIREYVSQRRANLLADPEVAAVGPTIANVSPSGAAAASTIHITAAISGPDPIASAYLYYRPTPDVPYSRVAMVDDGTAGDGAAGDGVYGAQLPVQGTIGQTLTYYVGATAQNTWQAQSFMPVRSENGPLELVFEGVPVGGPIVINELMAKNNSTLQDEAGSWEDYVELYNRGTTTVDLSGMYMTDDLSEPTEWQIPAGTTLAPGATLLIWADEDLTDGPLHADFKLSTDGEDVALFDVDGLTLLDAFSFGPQVADIATGRLHDGGELWVTFAEPTPGTLNDAGAGVRPFDQLDPAVHTMALSASGSTSIGGALTFSIQNAPVAAPVLFGWGLGALHASVDAIVALVNPLQFNVLMADGLGAASLTIPIPADPALVGLDVYCQSANVQTLGAYEASNALHVSLLP